MAMGEGRVWREPQRGGREDVSALGAFNGFLAGEPESPASGVEKLVGTRNPLFYTREKFPRLGECPSHFFYVQNAP
jgi:hypothetical protein